MEFAGFTFPKQVYIIPHGRNRAEGIRKRRELRKVCGPYYTFPVPDSRNEVAFYLESDFAPGLRWQWADDVVRIDHTGWFTNQYGDGDTVRGIVMRLTRGHGFLAGWSMGEGMASAVDRHVYDDENEAAWAADTLAKYAAENMREANELEEEEEEEEEEIG